MNRTLHMIDQPGAIAEAAVLRLSVDTVRQSGDDPREHAWLLVGGQATRDAARAVGLSDGQFQLLPRPSGLQRVFPAMLTRLKAVFAQAHRVVCWTEGAAEVASLVGCTKIVRRVDQATLCPSAKRVIDRAYDAEAESAGDRSTLRQRWGVSEGALVILLLADRFDQVDCRGAAMMMALTHEALRAGCPEAADVRLLCHPLAHRRAEAAMLLEQLSFGHLQVQEPQVAMPWSVLPGCDIALTPRAGEAGLSILWAQAAGVPVVTPQDRCLPMLEAMEGVTFARSGEPKVMADALTRWARASAGAREVGPPVGSSTG